MKPNAEPFSQSFYFNLLKKIRFSDSPLFYLVSCLDCLRRPDEESVDQADVPSLRRPEDWGGPLRPSPKSPGELNTTALGRIQFYVDDPVFSLAGFLAVVDEALDTNL